METNQAHTANPINPTGVPRGPAKTLVYEVIGRLASLGPNIFERAAMQARQKAEDSDEDEPCPAASLLLEDAQRQQGKRLKHSDRAVALLSELDHLDYEVLRHDGDRMAAKTADQPDQTREMKVCWGDLEREQIECALTLFWSASSEERATLDDLRFLHGLAMREPFADFCDAIEAAREKFRIAYEREPPIIPERIDKAASSMVRKRHRRAEKTARQFRDQLANLPILDEKNAALTIADWTRNARKYGYVDSR